MANPVIAVRIDPAIKARIEQLAGEQNTTPSELARQVLTSHFEEKTTQAGPALLNPRTKLRPAPH